MSGLAITWTRLTTVSCDPDGLISFTNHFLNHLWYLMIIL